MLAEDIQQRVTTVFDLQGAHRWQVSASTVEQRIFWLKELKSAIIHSKEELIRAMHADFKKSQVEVFLTEIHPVLEEIHFAIKNLRRWMRPVRVASPLTLTGAKSFVQYESRGRVLIMAPWNYPINLLIAPLVAALAAGNCIILKPSNKVPHTTKVLVDIINRVFRPEHVAIFAGGGELGDFLLTLAFDHFFFTGSPPVGQRVMAAASKHLATVTLELGGKSPAIIDESANFETAVKQLLWGKFVNAGQTCIAPDYVFVPDSRMAEFVEVAKATLNSFYGPVEGRRANPDFSRIVDGRSFSRLKKALEESLTQGATIEVGGQLEESELYIAPTILSQVTVNSAIMSDEIFGPILPILTYRHRQEVIDYIQSRPKPLALYIFAKKRKTVDDLLRQTTSGGAVVNNLLVQAANPSLPFGGVGRSGQGNYHGFFGFRTFSHERAIVRQGLGSLASVFYPPYGRKIQNILQRLLSLYT